MSDMSDISTEDISALRRITDQMNELINRSKGDMVEYGLALAAAARSVHKIVHRFGGPDVARYERLGKTLQDLTE